MRISLPKDLPGFAFERVLPIELNSFDIDILLPAVFFKVVSSGRDRGRLPNDPAKISEYINALACHPSLRGFNGSSGRKSLERLVRTTLIQTGRQGVRRGTEQIQGLTGYTLLTCSTVVI